MSMSSLEHAEQQFLSCIQQTPERDLKLFANLNLAIIYLRAKREDDLRAILDTVSTENSQCLNSQALMGGFYYVQGLNSFHKNSFHEAKYFVLIMLHFLLVLKINYYLFSDVFSERL